MTDLGPGPERVRDDLDRLDYLADDGLAMAVHLALALGLPLLLEGEPGVGKTSAAKAVAGMLGAPLLRLQCYEGLGPHEALYEWSYHRQLLAIRLAESHDEALSEADLFAAEFLDERPLLAALRHPGPTPAVLLIDEVDRADDEFEALLLEFLGEGAMTIPELGTVTAAVRPVVVLTSNRTRELHDALRRRCLYHWIEFPPAGRMEAILRRTVPDATEQLVLDATGFVGRVRALDLDKPPGMAEAVNWVSALELLGARTLRPELVRGSLGTLVKTPDDRVAVLAALEHGSLLVDGPATRGER